MRRLTHFLRYREVLSLAAFSTIHHHNEAASSAPNGILAQSRSAAFATPTAYDSLAETRKVRVAPGTKTPEALQFEQAIPAS